MLRLKPWVLVPLIGISRGFLVLCYCSKAHTSLLELLLSASISVIVTILCLFQVLHEMSFIHFAEAVLGCLCLCLTIIDVSKNYST